MWRIRGMNLKKEIKDIIETTEQLLGVLGIFIAFQGSAFLIIWCLGTILKL
jgi:hypothetical protein